VQILSKGKTVNEQITKDLLLKILADKYSRIILQSTIDLPKSPYELSDNCHIPISTVYRRVLELHHKNLLEIYDSSNKEGKKYFLYKSKIKSIAACFSNGTVELEVVPN